MKRRRRPEIFVAVFQVFWRKSKARRFRMMLARRSWQIGLTVLERHLIEFHHGWLRHKDCFLFCLRIDSIWLTIFMASTFIPEIVELQWTDSFHSTPRGSSHKHKNMLCSSEPQAFKLLKRSIIAVKNQDQLWCTRIIVAANPKWIVIPTARIPRRRLCPNWVGRDASSHGDETKVKIGPCGYEKLQAFA